LNTYNGIGSSTVNFNVAGERGTVLKRANMGFNVPGGNSGGNIPANVVVPSGLFPPNWITANPQVAAANYYTNTGTSNYHSLQVQGTIRTGQSLTLQGTYVWSRALALSSGGYTNPAERSEDYNLAANHVTHDFRANATYALPFGPNKLLFRNTRRWVARTIEGWQTSFIINANTGSPVSIGAGNMLYGNGVPDVVGPFSAKPFGSVQWNGDSGNQFGSSFAQTPDPQCGQLAAELKPYCTLQAVTDAKTGQVLLQNPLPGHRGTLGQKTLELPGAWAFDSAISKSIRITESKTMQFRMDATNVFNHPLLGSPNLSLNGTTPFGSIQTKGTQRRQFKAQLRLNF
jgi:hypothetical protein